MCRLWSLVQPAWRLQSSQKLKSPYLTVVAAIPHNRSRPALPSSFSCADEIQSRRDVFWLLLTERRTRTRGCWTKAVCTLALISPAETHPIRPRHSSGSQALQGVSPPPNFHIIVVLTHLATHPAPTLTPPPCLPTAFLHLFSPFGTTKKNYHHRHGRNQSPAAPAISPSATA